MTGIVLTTGMIVPLCWTENLPRGGTLKEE